MPPGARWRVPSPPLRSAASNFERLPPESSEHWRALLGRKISIRYRLSEGDSHPFSEAVGVVLEVSDENGVVVKIMTRHGQTLTVHASDVLAGKVFPT